MRFLIELDGPVLDIAPVMYAAHRIATAEVGWSTLDQATFWRLTRTGGSEANLLPGARPAKTSAYAARFAEVVEQDEVIATATAQPGVADDLRGLASLGPLVGLTLGSNLEARRQVLHRTGLKHSWQRIEVLSADPRRRPAELLVLAESDPSAIVLSASDALLRSGDAAGVFGVGLSCGSCTAARLHRAGARLVFQGLTQFLNELRAGGPELVRHGLRPFGRSTWSN